MAGPELSNWLASAREMMRPLRDLLTASVTALGRTGIEHHVKAVYGGTVAMMRRYVGSADRPGPEDIEHLVKFCLLGLGVR